MTTEREVAIALYRLQVELLGSPGALAVHREWGRGLHAIGERVNAGSDLDVRLVIASLDGIRMSALNSGDSEWVRAAVHRQMEALFRAGA